MRVYDNIAAPTKRDMWLDSVLATGTTGEKVTVRIDRDSDLTVENVSRATHLCFSGFDPLRRIALLPKGCADRVERIEFRSIPRFVGEPSPPDAPQSSMTEVFPNVTSLSFYNIKGDARVGKFSKLHRVSLSYIDGDIVFDESATVKHVEIRSCPRFVDAASLRAACPELKALELEPVNNINIPSFPELQILTVYRGENVHIPSFPKLQTLSVSGCGKVTIDDRQPELLKLSVGECADFDRIPLCQKLEEITVQSEQIQTIPSLPNLKKVYAYDSRELVAVSAMPNLVDLGVANCPKLKRIGGSNIKAWSSLQITNCPNLEVLGGRVDAAGTRVSVSPRGANIFPKLNKVEFTDKKVWKGVLARQNTLSVLESLNPPGYDSIARAIDITERTVGELSVAEAMRAPTHHIPVKLVGAFLSSAPGDEQRNKNMQKRGKFLEEERGSI